MKSKAPAQSEQSQNLTARTTAFGQAAQRSWQEPAGKSPHGMQAKARTETVNNTPSVLPQEPLADSSNDSLSEPQQRTPFGSIRNSPRLIAQSQPMLPFSLQESSSKPVQRLIRKDDDGGVDLYHSAGWKYDLDYQITAEEGHGATQGDAGVAEIRETLASWLDVDYVNLEQVSADSMSWLVKNDFAEPGDDRMDPEEDEAEATSDKLNEYGKVYTYEAGGYVVQDDATIIPMPRELIRVTSDLRDDDAEDGVGAYRPDFVCVLLSLWPDDGGPAGWAANDDNLTQLANSGALRDWLQAQHETYLGDNVEYDQSPFFNRVLGASGKNLIYSGETPWSELAEAAGLEAGKEYIIVTVNHCMRIHYRGGDDADAYNVLNFDLNGQRNHQYAAGTEVVMVWS